MEYILSGKIFGVVEVEVSGIVEEFRSSYI